MYLDPKATKFYYFSAFLQSTSFVASNFKTFFYLVNIQFFSCKKKNLEAIIENYKKTLKKTNYWNIEKLIKYDLITPFTVKIL